MKLFLLKEASLIQYQNQYKSTLTPEQVEEIYKTDRTPNHEFTNLFFRWVEEYGLSKYKDILDLCKYIMEQYLIKRKTFNLKVDDFRNFWNFDEAVKYLDSFFDTISYIREGIRRGSGKIS